MFLDLVGSTALSTRFDAEDLREVLLSYQKACVGAIERFGGRVSRYMGDGMMVYFGFPQAQEDAPQRAGLAGLAILEEIAQLNETRYRPLGITLQMRIGIHVGRVVTGEMGAGSTREAMEVVGVTPNIAARLESLAPADSVLVSAQVKARIEQQFELESLGHKTLKGIEEPVEVFKLLRAKQDDPSSQTSLQPRGILTGRRKELEALTASWSRAREQQSVQLVSVQGEPGIGKSGLLQLFLDQIGIDKAQRVVWRCSIYDSDTPLLTVWQSLAEDFGLRSGETEAETRDRIDAGLARCGGEERAALETVADLLLAQVHSQKRATNSDHSDSMGTRRELFRAIPQCLRHKADPLLLVLEDAHWADPSTLELVNKIIRQSTDWAIMVLVLTRPTDAMPWHDVDQQRLALEGLPTADCEEIIQHMTGGRPLERSLCEYIFASTDGSPLFVEELTKSILDSGQLVERRGRLALSGDAEKLEAPGTLLDLLTVRLDRLGPAKETAQTAAVIGRDFRLDALSYMSDSTREQIQHHLAELVRCDMIAEIEGGDGSRYQFRHALYQKVAYESLLRRHRRALHGAYLGWLETNPVAQASLLSEQLAFHNELAGFDDAAVALWTEAGEIATSASASQEAVRHFEAGLRILRSLPQTDANHVLNLKLHALLGGALIMSKGPGAPETREVYKRALGLCDKLPRTAWHFPVFWGWWRISENLTVMLSRAQQLVQIADEMQEAEYRLQAHHCLWANAYMVGDHESVLQHAGLGLEIYDEGSFSETGSLYGGHDPKVCGLGEKALSLWLMGDADRAASTLDNCLAFAEEMGHLGSRLHALDFALMLHHFRSDPDAVGQIAATLRSVSEKYELEDYLAKADIFEGWRLLESGHGGAGAELLEQGLATMRQVGTREDFPVYFAMAAESRLQQDQARQAIDLLEEGLCVIADEGLAYWAAEIHRLSGEALAAMDAADTKAIDAHLTKAIEVARSQGALALELRAATSQARQLRRRGQFDAGLACLLDVVARMDESADIRDLKEATALIEDLREETGQSDHELV